MKRTLVSLAVLGTVGAACAQSSITIFGVVDLGVSYYQTNSQYQSNGVASATPRPDLKQSQWALSNSGNASSDRSSTIVRVAVRRCAARLMR